MGAEQEDYTRKLADLEKRLLAVENRLQVGPTDQKFQEAQEITYKAGATANASDPVTHPLKREPVGFLVVSQDAAGSVYKDTTNRWTSDKIFLRSSVANVTYRLRVY